MAFNKWTSCQTGNKNDFEIDFKLNDRDHHGRLSFNPDDCEEVDKIDDFENEEDETDLILLAEGANFPYGYIPLYRDRSTLCLVMKRNRSLTTEQVEEARKFSLEDHNTDVQRDNIKRWRVNIAAAEGDYDVENSACK